MRRGGIRGERSGRGAVPDYCARVRIMGTVGLVSLDTTRYQRCHERTGVRARVHDDRFTRIH